MPEQPREAGKFVCVPSYPRKRPSPCGCSGGGSHPCPIAARTKSLRAAARKHYKRNVTKPKAPTPEQQEDIEDLDRELYEVGIELEAMTQALDWTRQQIHNANGNIHHSSRTSNLDRLGGFRAAEAVDSFGDVSERGYPELLEERSRILAHINHLKYRRRDIRDQLRELYGKAPRRARRAA